jgi:hypothetical protein
MILSKNLAGIISSIPGLCQRLSSLSEKWNTERAEKIKEEIDSIIPLLRKKDFGPIKKGLQHCNSTLAGCIAGKVEQLLTKSKCKSYIRKLGLTITPILEAIHALEIDTIPEKEELPTISFKPGVDLLDQSIQERLSLHTLDDNGNPRQSANKDLSTMEQIWEEAEYKNILRQESLNAWDKKFYGPLDMAYEKYKSQIDKIPRFLNKPAELFRVPIVPYSAKEVIFRDKELAKTDVELVFIAGFPIFENQIVLAINTNRFQDEMLGIQAYEFERSKHSSTLANARDKYLPIRKMELQIKEYQEELSFLTEPLVEGTGINKEDAQAVRTLRSSWINAEIEKLIVNINARKVKYADLFKELEVGTAKLREISKGKPKDSGDSVKRTLETAEEYLKIINSKLSFEEQLGLVTNTPYPYGYGTTYFWLMKDSNLAKWNVNLSFNREKLNISSWSFVNPPETKSAFEHLQAFQTELQNFVLSSIRNGLTIDQCCLKLKVYLKKRRKTYGNEHRELVKKIYSDFSDSGIKRVDLKAPKVRFLV